MSRCFRCLNIYTTEVDHCYTLSELLGLGSIKKGFHAFYCHGSIISDYHTENFDPQVVRSASVLKEYFQKVGVTEHKVPSPKTELVFAGKDLFLLAHKAKPPAEFAEKIVLAFGGKLRAALDSNTPYGNLPGYALYQASILNLLSEAYEQSAIYDTGGLYREYLLWNDNGLWTQDEWKQRADKLQNIPSLESQTNLSTAQADIPNEPASASSEMPQSHPAEPRQTPSSSKSGLFARFFDRSPVTLGPSSEPTLTQVQPIVTETQISTEEQQADLSAGASSSTAGQAKLSFEQANLRLAWLGSGWLSSRLEGALAQNPSNYATDPYPCPPEIEAWAKAALERLMAYDAVLLAYYRKEQKADLPGWQAWQNYIGTLCEFLPYHKPRNSTNPKREDYLPTNSSGSRGGPRLWQGYLGPQVNMHIRHLLLDGWLTLWPVEGKLYYQPGSLALLYWAAKHADKPYTNSPKDFIENYDWSAAWFGGNWRGLQHGGQ